MTNYVLTSLPAHARQVDVHLEPTEKRVAIFLSGGIDSAVLLCALLRARELQNLDVEFTALTVNTVGSDTYAAAILEEIQPRYGPVHHQQDLPNPGAGPGRILPEIREVRAAGRFDVIYNGSNANPPPELVRLKGEYPERPRVRRTANVILPFHELFKNHVLEIGYQLDLERIFELSHSCTELVRGMCGHCFACDERRWGFEVLRRKDPAPRD